MKQIFILALIFVGLTAYSQTKTVTIGNATAGITEGDIGDQIADSLTALKNIQLNAVDIGGDHYVATWGDDDNAGTFDAPWATWQKAFTEATAGDTIYIRGGVYYSTAAAGASRTDIDGTASNKICIWNYPGEVSTIDMSNGNITGQGFGVLLTRCDYWHLKGLHVRNVKENVSVTSIGFNIVGCSYTTLENCSAYDNAGVGISVGDFASIGSTGVQLINCDSYNNYDVLHSGENANGIELVYLDSLSVTTATGCRAWNNSDDGFDFWASKGILNITDCWSFQNGRGSGDGDGFKLGTTYFGATATSLRVMSRNIASNNKLYGFDQNGANAIMTFYNNTAYDNNADGFELSEYDTNVKLVKNNISYGNDGDGDAFGDNDDISNNSWQNGLVVSDADFVSVDTLDLYKPRKEDGSLPDIDFMQLASSSDLIDAGVGVELQYNGLYPDIGYDESYVTNLAYLPSYSKVLNDGNTVGWFVFDDMETITKSVTNDSVAAWNDRLGSGHDLVQATNTNRPQWTENGIQFDGADNYLKAVAFTYNQPEQIYLVVKQLSWTQYDHIINGNSADVMNVYQNSSTPEIKAYAGTLSNAISPTLNTWGVIRVLFNGANSELILDDGTAVTGNFGTSNAGGITVGAKATGAEGFAHCIIKEIIFRSVADTPANEAIIYNYLRGKYGL